MPKQEKEKNFSTQSDLTPNGVKGQQSTGSSTKKAKKKTTRKKCPKGANDLAWYNHYPELSNGMIGANFMRRKGIGEFVCSGNNFQVPSVFGLETILVNSKSEGEGYKTGVDKLYAALRSGNTGSPAYTKLDLQGYLLNLRFILAEIRYLRRAYGVMRYYQLMDKTIPVSLIKVMGLDYDSFVENSANLRNTLNTLSVKLHTQMPGKFDLLERTAWMFDNVFADSDDAKAQLYLFTLASESQFMYDFSNSSIVTITTSNSIVNFANNSSNTGVLYNNAITNLRAHISLATEHDKVAMIAADILKCFGLNQISYFNAISEDYTIKPVFSEEVLTQIQNSRSLGGARSSTATQDSRVEISILGAYMYSNAHMATTPYTANDSDLLLNDSYINMYKNNITNLDLLGATRLTFTAHLDSNVAGRYNLDTFGTELIQHYNIVSNKPYGDTSTYLYNMFNHTLESMMSTDAGSGSSFANALLRFALWTSFDWAPMVRPSAITGFDNSGTAYKYGIGAYPFWDFNNYAIIATKEVDTYHDICAMSLYYYPSAVRNVNLITY